MNSPDTSCNALEHLHAATGRSIVISLAYLLWAHRKYGLHVGHKTTQLGAEFAEKIEAETEAVRLVSCAYNRAQRMSAAHKEAADMTAADAAARLELEYTHSGTRVSSVEACQIAIFADINPADLWIQYGAFFGKTFEIARFVGRINAGVEAWLGPELFETARQVLAARTQETDLSLLWVNLRELLNLAISTASSSLVSAAPKPSAAPSELRGQRDSFQSGGLRARSRNQPQLTSETVRPQGSRHTAFRNLLIHRQNFKPIHPFACASGSVKDHERTDNRPFRRGPTYAQQSRRLPAAPRPHRRRG